MACCLMVFFTKIRLLTTGLNFRLCLPFSSIYSRYCMGMKNSIPCSLKNSPKSLDIPITKYVKSVEFLSKKNKNDEQIYSCINCGNCRFACPVKLSPDILYNHTVNFKLLKENFSASSLACIECGLCNTVCPARLPLCQTIKVLKNKLTE